MRRVIVVALAAGCGPRIEGEVWRLLDPLPGEDLLTQKAGCDLTMQADPAGVGLRWPEDCGREDLPTTLSATHGWVSGMAYTPGGGHGTGKGWVTRDGEHPGLKELWVYDHQVDDPKDYDAVAVLRLVRGHLDGVRMAGE